MAALAGAMLLSIIPAASTMAGVADAPKVVRQAEWNILARHNNYRASRGLAPLRMAQQARLAARQRSQEMKNLNYLSHTSPTGKHATTLLARRGVNYQAGAENIGRVSWLGWDAVNKGVMNAWKNSSGHRQNILSTNFNYVGVGIARNNSKVYFTVIFLLQKDHSAPQSGMLAASTGISVAAASDGSRNVTVRWWGRDRLLQRNTSGIRSFTVQYKKAGGSWRTVREATLTKSLTKNLSEGAHFFRVRSVDNRGNRGSWGRTLRVTVH